MKIPKYTSYEEGFKELFSIDKLPILSQIEKPFHHKWRKSNESWKITICY